MPEKELPVIPHSVSSSIPSYDRIKMLSEQLADAIQGLEKEVEGMNKLDMTEAAKKFVCLHAIYQLMDANNKSFGSIFNDIKTFTFPRFAENEGQSSITLDAGFRVGVSWKVYAAMKGSKKQEATQWLVENDLGELITETVNASTLSAAVKVMIEDHFVEPPEDLFNVTVQGQTSVTRVKSKT